MLLTFIAVLVKKHPDGKLTILAVLSSSFSEPVGCFKGGIVYFPCFDIIS